MGASLKVNLVLLAVAAIVVELFTVVSTPFLENVARAEVLQKARIMMEAAAGIRTYTSNEIAPLLNARTDGEEFYAQTIPAYAATKNFALLASKFRDYAYREAALNPINLANRAVDWETDIINNFRGNPEKRELVTERETDGGRVLHLSQPIISGGPCLTCHGSVGKAPRAILSAYGTENGFGWKLDDIVGAQIVSVPMAVAFADAAKVKNLFVGVLAGVFVLMIGLFNLLPILMKTVSQAGGRTTQITSAHLTMAEFAQCVRLWTACRGDRGHYGRLRDCLCSGRHRGAWRSTQSVRACELCEPCGGRPGCFHHLAGRISAQPSAIQTSPAC